MLRFGETNVRLPAAWVSRLPKLDGDLNIKHIAGNISFPVAELIEVIPFDSNVLVNI